MKTNHKNFAKWSAKKEAITNKKAVETPEPAVDVEEEFVFNIDAAPEAEDAQTDGGLFNLPQIQPEVDETVDETPPEEATLPQDSVDPYLLGPDPVETAYFLL